MGLCTLLKRRQLSDPLMLYWYQENAFTFWWLLLKECGEPITRLTVDIGGPFLHANEALLFVWPRFSLHGH